MKKIIFYTIITCFLFADYLYSAPGDKNIVRTIDFQARRIGWFDFPTEGKSYEQILMHFKLRCPPGKPCGEWDYLSYVFLNKWYAPSFRADGKVVDTLRFMTDTSWTYSQVIEGGEKKIIKTAKKAIKIEFYNDEENPTKLTDTIMVFPTYYDNYTFDDNGNPIDSNFVEPDSMIILSKKRVYYDDDVTYNERWELFRYITPYGNGITLGEGVTWTIDVTDFAPLLTGKVHLDSPYGGWGDPYDNNEYEDLELTFEFIEGTPPRNIVNVKQLWNYYGVTYDKDFENKVAAYNYTFDENEKTAILRVTQTGHGFGGTADNCAEFCRKLGMLKVDGATKYERYVWRLCGDNPIYPQGGTWIFDRSNWCPGAEVNPFDFEITPFINHGTEQALDYDMEYYDLQWAGGDNTKPNWVLTGFLFTYGDINHELDGRITKIVAPNNDRLMNRFNPICGYPIIEIQNVGKNTISQVTVKYGNDLDNLVISTVQLDNPLNFMEKAEIQLPNNDFYNDEKPNIFNAEIIEVNGKADDYEFNNKLSAEFDTNIPEFVNNFTLELRTPNSEVLGITSPIKYYLTDIDGNILYSRGATENSKQYSDDIHLEDGCYRLTIINEQGYGLGFWAYEPNLQRGYLRFTLNGSALMSFPTDWGNFYSMEFRVGAVPELVSNIEGDTLHFGDIDLGKSITKTIEINPKNEKGLVIENASIVLGNNKKYEIIATNPEPIDDKWELNFGEKLELTILFEPKSAGVKNSPLRIQSNDFYKWQYELILNGKGVDPVSVADDEEDNLEIKISTNYYNNESTLKLNIEVNEINSTASIAIYDVLGNRLFEVPRKEINDYKSELFIDLSNYNSGAYYINFVYKGQIRNIPIVIAK